MAGGQEPGAWLTAPGFQANGPTTSNGSIPGSSWATIAKYTAWFPLLTNQVFVSSLWVFGNWVTWYFGYYPPGHVGTPWLAWPAPGPPVPED